MRGFLVFNSLVLPVIALDPITISYYTDENCAFSPLSPYYPALFTEQDVFEATLDIS